MSRNGRMILLVVLILLGVGVRLYQLDEQSMWSDEGLSLYRARQPLPELLAGTILIDGQASQDTNPPLYFLLLSGLRALAGESVFVLRYFSVLTAVLTLPLLYNLGRRIGGWQAGIGAVFWLMLSPLHIWQSQDMRNYTLLLFWNLLSVYALSQIVLPGKAKQSSPLAKWGALWAAATLAGIYTHYFGLFVLAFGILALFLWVVQRWQGWPPPRWLIWTAVVLGSITMPILWMTLSRFRGAPQVDFVFVQPQHFLLHVLSAFSVGIRDGVVQPWWRIAPVLILAIWGSINLWRSGQRAATLFLLGYLFIPLFLLETLSYFNPLYNGARHLIVSLPPFLLLLGTVVSAPLNQLFRPRLKQLAMLVLVLSIGVSQAEWLYQQFTAESLVKDDIKGLAQFLTEVAQPEDVIVLHDTIIGFVFDYYYEGSASWTAVPAWGQHDPQTTLQSLQSAATGKQRVWFVDEPKPRIGFAANILPDWMDENWIPIARQRFSSLWLPTAVRGYAIDPIVEELPAAAANISANWTNGLTLVGAEWPDVAQSGSFWQPRLYWTSSETTPPDVALSVRLVDAEGQIWFQVDEPLWPDFPLTKWQSDTIIRMQPLISLPAGIPPGEYHVTLRLTDNATFQNIATRAGEIDVPVPEKLVVTAATAPTDLVNLPEHTQQSVRLTREIELVGYTLLAGAYRPGHLASFSLYWRVWRTPVADYQLQAEMVDANGNVTQLTTVPLSRPNHPPTTWQPNEILQSVVTIPVPGRAQTDQSIRVTLVDANGQSVHKPVTLGSIEVEPWEMITRLPPIETRLQASFGEGPFAILEGYELSATTAQAGETLSLSLIWRTGTPLEQNLIVFVHLADANENLVGQGDGVPVNGVRLTDSWRSGEILVDTHTIQINPETAVGSYKLWVGFYDPVTNERLPVQLDGVEQPDGRLLLTEIKIQ